MCVLSLNSFPKTNTTTTFPWPSPSKDNKLTVNPEREKNMVSSLLQPLITHGFDSTGGFVRTSWHSIMNTNTVTEKRALYKSRGDETQTKQVKLTDGSCETLHSWLTTPPVSQSEGVSPRSDCPCGCLLSFTVQLSPKTTCCMIFQENPNNHCFFHTWDLAPFNYDLFKEDDMANRNAPENKSVLPQRSFWSSWPLASFIKSFKSFSMSNWHIFVQICPSNK